MVIIAVGLKSRAGQQGGHQLFQAAEVVAVIIVVGLVKADDIVHLGTRCKAGQGGKELVKVLIIRLSNQINMAVWLLQLQLQQGADQLVDMRPLGDNLRCDFLLGNHMLNIFRTNFRGGENRFLKVKVLHSLKAAFAHIAAGGRLTRHAG